MCQALFKADVYVGLPTVLLASITLLQVAGPGSPPASQLWGEHL